MATAISGEKIITIEGQKYKVRTVIQYQNGLGVRGTLSTTAPIRYTVEYLPGPTFNDPVPVWRALGERNNTSKNKWNFTPIAGAGFKKALTASGPTSLTSSLDDSATNALSKSASVTKQQATLILDVARNKEPTSSKPDPIGGDPNQPGGDPPAAPVLPPPGSTLTSAPTQSLIISPGEGLRYPKEIAGTGQDVIKFQALEYVDRGFGSDGKLPEANNSVFEIPGPKTRPAQGPGPGGGKEGPVYMAIQASITDQNSVEWGSGNISAIDAAIFNLSYNLVLDNKQATQDNIKGMYKELEGQTGRIQKYLAGKAASINNILARTDNVALNTNLELLFQSPQLRPFNFQFKMSARDKPEADTIKSIIKYFKYHMAARKETGVFLKAPHVFGIQYLHKNTPHQGINKIKTCALTNFSVDYTPLGTYATYDDGTMVAYTLSMSFQEIIPVYDDDYSGHSIGF